MTSSGNYITCAYYGEKGCKVEWHEEEKARDRKRKRI
jgi:hypothetical protein